MAVILISLFLIWPFGVTIFSFLKYNKKWSKNIVWGFVIFYSFLFVLSNDTMDANRLLSKFEFFQFNNYSFGQVIDYFYLENEDGVDIIQPIILYLIAKVTDNFQILMGVLGIILGYFYSRNIDFIYSNAEKPIRPYNYLLIWMFIFVIGFWEINMFRFWTSALMYFFSISPYLLNNDNRRLWILPLIPFLHFSFLLPVFAFLLFFVIKGRFKLVFIGFVASFFLSSINTETVGNLLISVLPSNYHYKVSAYTDSSYAQEVAAAETSISKYLRLSMFAIINVSFIILFFESLKDIKANIKLRKYFVFVLYILSLGNVASLIPSGDRFQYVSSLFAISFLIFFIQQYNLKGKLKMFLQMFGPILFLASFGLIRLALNTIDILVVLGNPIVAPFIEGQKALIEFF